MLKLKTILVPVDLTGDNSASTALGYAAKLADSDTTIYLLHVAEMFLLPDPNGNWYNGDFMASFFETAKKGFKVFEDKIRADFPGIHIESKFEEQKDPADFIIEMSEDLHADLIVMNSHGRKGLNRILMGSIAEYVMRHAKCPVMIVKNPS